MQKMDGTRFLYVLLSCAGMIILILGFAVVHQRNRAIRAEERLHIVYEYYPMVQALFADTIPYVDTGLPPPSTSPQPDIAPPARKQPTAFVKLSGAVNISGYATSVSCPPTPWTPTLHFLQAALAGYSVSADESSPPGVLTTLDGRGVKLRSPDGREAFVPWESGAAFIEKTTSTSSVLIKGDFTNQNGIIAETLFYCP